MTPGSDSRKEETGEVVDYISHRYLQVCAQKCVLLHIKPLPVSILFNLSLEKNCLHSNNMGLKSLCKILLLIL